MDPVHEDVRTVTAQQQKTPQLKVVGFPFTLTSNLFTTLDNTTFQVTLR
jgi:hypothetical protein